MNPVTNISEGHAIRARRKTVPTKGPAFFDQLAETKCLSAECNRVIGKREYVCLEYGSSGETTGRAWHWECSALSGLS